MVAPNRPQVFRLRGYSSRCGNATTTPVSVLRENLIRIAAVDFLTSATRSWAEVCNRTRHWCTTPEKES